MRAVRVEVIRVRPYLKRLRQNRCEFNNEKKKTILLLPLRKQRKNLTFLVNEEAHSFLRSQNTNRRSRKQLFRINCPIINLWNKQTVLRRNCFPWRASKNSSWVKSKKTEEKNKVRYKSFLRVLGHRAKYFPVLPST